MQIAIRLAVVLAAAAVALPSGAQSIDEITVTVRKKEENLQEVPMSIKALSADEIRRKGIDNLDDLTKNIAGLVFDQGITAQDTRVVVRGLSPTRGRQNIAFLQDGIDISSEAITTNGGSMLVNPRYLDFERIEVVKGPQSALYGRAAFNGAINYITKDPGDEFEFDISANSSTAAGSENNNYSANIAAGGPITDKFGLRASAAYWDEDGYYNNGVTAQENLGGGDGFGVSLKGLWRPRENLRIEGRVGYSDDNYEQRPGAFLDYNSITFLPGESLTPQWVVQEFFGGDRNDSSNYAYEVCGHRYDAAGGAMAGVEDADTAATACAQGARQQAIDGVQPGENELKELSARVKSPLVSAPVANYIGQVPDSDQLQVRISPDQNTIDPNGINLPRDLPGTQIEVLRGTLNLQWDLTGGNIQAWAGYTDAKQRALFDFDKFAAAPDSIYGAVFQSPTGPGPDRLLGTADDIPCSLSGGDCSWGNSFVDLDTDTQQESLEIRYASERDASLNFTTGGLYWHEKTKQIEHGIDAFASHGAFPFVGPNFRDGMGGTIPNCYSAAAGPLPGVGMQAFMPDWVEQSLTPNDEGFLQSALQGPEDVSIPNGSNLLCPPSSSDILQYLDERAIVQPRFFEADTEHWSIYGMLDFELSEAWKFSVEGRYISEREEQLQPVLDTTAPFYGPRLSPSLIQPNCGQSPLSPIPDDLNTPELDPGFICVSYPIPPNAPPVTGPWTTPDTLATIVPGVNQVSVRSTYFTPRATLEWRPMDQQMYYLSYAVSKKPAGHSRVSSGSGGFSADEARFDEERLEVYELGTKTTLFKDRLLFNAAIFYQDFTDKQVPRSLINAETALPTASVINADAAEITGLEIEMTWAATDRLSLGLAYSYLDTEYTDFFLTTSGSNDLTRNSFEPLETDDPNLIGGGYFIGNSCTNISARSTIDASGRPVAELLCAVDLSGNELEGAPKNALNLNAIYRAPFITAGLEWFVEADFFYQDERFLDQSNSHNLDAYHLVDTRFGLLGDRWESVFYIDNLFDDDTVKTATTAPGLATGNFVNGPPRVRQTVIAYPAPPRVFGLQLNYRFGE
jgi:outer membrane receptor protein involved in Fe transport